MDEEFKKCSRCNETKHLRLFYYDSSNERYQSWCKDCLSVYRKQNITRIRLRHVGRVFGLSPAEYKDLLIKQDNACAICGMKPTKRLLAVDHDKNTGNVRGLLCSPCNTGIGQFQHNPELLLSAIHYLRQHLSEDDTE